MRSTWAGISSLFPVSQWIAYGEIPPGEEIAGRKSCRRGLGTKSVYGKNLAVVERLIEFAESRNHTVLDLAFAWLLAHKPVASVIAGASKPEQVRANTKAANWQLTSDDLAAIDAIMTGK